MDCVCAPGRKARQIEGAGGRRKEVGEEEEWRLFAENSRGQV